MLRSRRRRRLRKDASRRKKENNPRKDIQRWSIKVYVCSIHFFLSSSSSASSSIISISMRRCCCNFVARLTQLILCLSSFSSLPPSHSNLLYFEVGLKSKPKMELTTLHMNLPSSLARDVSSMKFCVCFDASPAVTSNAMTNKKNRNCYSRRATESRNDQNHLLCLFRLFLFTA